MTMTHAADGRHLEGVGAAPGVERLDLGGTPLMPEGLR